jgi:hypothetical protein
MDPVPPAVPAAPLTASVRMAAEGSSVRFNLPTSGSVDVDLFNVSGQLVRRIASGWFEAGEHALSVGSGGSGTSLGAGVYFVRLRAGEVTLSRKVVVAH